MRNALAVLMLLPAALAGAKQYVGSKVCGGCHSRIYSEYRKTAMGRSVQPASDTLDWMPAPGPFAVRRGDITFEIERRGDDLFETEYQTGASGEPIFKSSYKLEYAIGSGVNGATYLLRRGNYWFEAPLSYYSRVQKWKLSPGYENTNQGFNRLVTAGCVACHAGRANAIEDREGLFGEPAFEEAAIGCENCHGPGELHVRQRNKASIVNPARLPARLADDICMSCHQAGDTRVLQPGKTYSDFRPGTPLSGTLAIFKIPLDAATAKPGDLLEHHFSMQLSKCFRESGGKLSCLTCHNPHAAPPRENAAAFYNAKCLQCHQETSCKAPHAERVREANGCIGCHMPKRDVGFISHSALTNHRIIARPGEPLPNIGFANVTPELPDLIYLNRSGAKPIPQMTLWQAYAELMDRAPQYQIRYLALLDALTKTTPEEPLVEAALGRKALRESTPEGNQRAIRHLSRAVKLGFKGPAAFEDLAEALAREGRNDESIEALKRGMELSPYAPRLHKYLALRYIHAQRYDLAKQTMQHYIELFPEDGFVRQLLRNVENRK